MSWATFWAIFSQTHLATLISSYPTSRMSTFLVNGEERKPLKSIFVNTGKAESRKLFLYSSYLLQNGRPASFLLSEA
jgi:hypothetical protein